MVGSSSRRGEGKAVSIRTETDLSSIDPADPALRPTPARQALPDPGEPVPTLSWPIVGIFFAALALFAAGTWAAVGNHLPAVATIAMNAVAIFVMFTVLHDASHYSISSHRWVNGVFGRAAMLFVSPLISFPAFGFIHIEHHRHTNDDDNDPDHFASHGPWWQLPVRFAAMDVPYVTFYARNLRRRPRAELIETGASMTLAVGVIAAAVATGNIWMLALVYLIPQRVAMFALAWWFDWLPHHGLDETQSENRYRATRNRVGMEWLFTPLMLSQNYHLVHHLHPSVPFYRYLRTWRRNEEAYLERDAAISTAFGKSLDPDEFREWKRTEPASCSRSCRCGCRRARARRTRSSTGCPSPRSTRSPTTARWSPSPSPRSCATSSASSPAST